MRRNTLTKTCVVGALLLGLALPQSGLASRDRPWGRRGHRHRPVHILFEKHAERLGLDAKTLEKIRGISEATKEQSSDLRTKLREARMTMRQLLSAETPDKAAVMKQVEIMGAIMTDLRKHRMATILEIRALLTPKQRQELIEIVKEFRSKRGPHSPSPKGQK